MRAHARGSNQPRRRLDLYLIQLRAARGCVWWWLRGRGSVLLDPGACIDGEVGGGCDDTENTTTKPNEWLRIAPKYHSVCASKGIDNLALEQRVLCVYWGH